MTKGKMDKLCKNTLNIYTNISCDILELSSINNGICIDIGTGPAFLAIEIAKNSDLEIYATDISSEMLRIARENIKKEKLENRITPLVADVHNLPFENNFADLIVSRGSMFFWKDMITAFNEIDRTLKKGGFAYIGGGYGNSGLDKIHKKYRRSLKQTDNNIKEIKKPPKISTNKLNDCLNSTNILNYKIINDKTGLWIHIHK